jgi:hypothetical protein
LRVASLRNIAPDYTLLRRVGHQCRRIGIDGGAVEQAQPLGEIRPKFVVGSFEALQGLRIETQQEGPQGVAMRKVVHTEQGRDESVVNQALSVLDATQAHHNGSDMGQKHVRRMITPVIVVGPTHEGLQEAANCKSPAKGLKEAQPAKAGKPSFFEGEMEFSRAFWHIAQMYLKRTFVQRPN